MGYPKEQPGADFRLKARQAAILAGQQSLLWAIYEATRPAEEEPDFDPIALELGGQ